MYNYNHNDNDLKLNLIKNTNIINHKSVLPYHSNVLHNLQAPCSLYLKNDKYFLTVDINCHITLLFELFIDIPLIDKMYCIDEIENLTFLLNKFFIDNQ